MNVRHLVTNAITGLAVAALVAVVGTVGTAGADERVERLEREVAELRAELAEARDGESEARLDELERRLAVLAEELERLRVGEAAAVADESELGFGPAASKIYRTEQGLSLGGYGEMVYENPEGGTAEADFLRAIVYVGYKFDDRWLLNTEIEFEHASTSKSGSASVEFAYLDYLASDELGVRAGLLLVPMGFINELHEPTTFLGTQRPSTERRIIPTTWRENGVGVFGEIGEVSYRSYLVNGLKGENFSSSGLRGGRQKGSNALAEDIAWVGRVDWTALPGLILGGSLYHGGSGQDLGIDLTTTIVEGHADWRWQGLQARALVAAADLDDVAELNSILGLTGAGSVGEELEGAYLEVGYDVLAGRDAAVIPFVRWEALDTQAAVPDGFVRNPARDQEILTLGVNWQPIPELVFKADWQEYDDDSAGGGRSQWNVGLGYIF